MPEFLMNPLGRGPVSAPRRCAAQARRAEDGNVPGSWSCPQARRGDSRARLWPVWLLLTLLLTGSRFLALAAEVIPPAPTKYFSDYAHVVSPATVTRLNQTLEDFERQTSSQILVVVFPKMESDSSIEDYTVRVAQAWRVGQQAKNNGAVLFVFIQDRQMYLQVGYGLEGALPDALAKRIIETEIKPRFRNGDFDGGLTAGVNAILAATRGEYKGTGRTVADGGSRGSNIGPIIMVSFIGGVFVVIVLLSALGLGRRRGTVYRSGGYTSWGSWPVGGSSWGSSSGGWTGGGGDSSGGFSSGGGSFGGGGAGGSW